MYRTETLGLEEARTAMEAVINKALAEPARPVAIAVVDKAGELICYARMDGANRFNQLMAIRKASTAAQLGVDTKLLRQGLKAIDMSFTDMGSTELTIVPGGVCVYHSGTRAVLGGIGVSGRLYHEDEDLARSGADTLAL